MAITAQQRKDIVKLAVEMFNVAPGGYLEELIAIYESNGANLNALANILVSTPAFKENVFNPVILTNDEIATKMTKSFGMNDITTGAGKEAHDYFLAQLNSGVSISDLYVAAHNYLAGDPAPEFQPVAQAIENKTVVAEYYTVNMATNEKDLGKLAAAVAPVTADTDVSTPDAIQQVVSATAAAATGQTFTLTNSANPQTGGVDDIKGTDAGDTISGVWNTTDGNTTSSINAGDTIDGKGGNDTLFLNILGDDSASNNAPNLSGVVVTNVETLKLSNNGTGAGTTTIDMTTLQGVKKADVISSLATGDTTLSNLSSIIDASMANGKGDLTLGYTAATTAGTSDVQNLKVNGQQNGNFIANGVETINVDVAAKSTLNSIQSTSLKKVTITGDNDLSIKTTVEFGNAANSAANFDGEIDASNFTGNLHINAGNGGNNNNGPQAVKVVTGSGDDVIDMENDLSANDYIDGGAGTDTLVYSKTTVGATDFDNVQNIEILSIAPTANATIDTSKISGIQTVLGELKQNASMSHQIKFGGAFNGTTANDSVTLNIAGTSLSVSFGDTANSVTANSIDGLGTVLAYNINNNSTVNALVYASYDSTADILKIEEKTVNPQVIKLTVVDGNDGGFSTQVIGADANAVNNDRSNVDVVVVNSTSGTLQLDNVSSGNTVKLDSTNLTPYAVDSNGNQTSTAQAAALNKMGAITINVKDATQASNTSDVINIELNNNNTTSVATKASNKVFDVVSVTSAGVETVNIDSIGTFGANKVETAAFTAAKKVVIKGDQALTIDKLQTNPAAELDATQATGNLTIAFDNNNGAINYNKDQVIKTGAGNDTVTVLGFDAGDTVDLGAGNDTFKFSAAADVGIINVANTETIQFTNGTNDAAAADLRNVTGLQKLIVDTGSNSTSVGQIGDGVAVQLLGTTGGGTKTVTLGGQTATKSMDVSIGKDGTATSTNGVAFGGTSAFNVTLSNGIETLNLTADGQDYGATTGAGSKVEALKGDSLKAINLNLSAGKGDLTIATLDATKLEGLNVTGGADKADTVLTVKAINDATSLASIDFSGATAKINFGFDGTNTYDFFKTKDGASIKLGEGDDTITWDAQNNGANTINGGNGIDNLVITGNQLSPGIIDLSDTTDQVKSFGGVANSAVQIGFENVDVSNVTGKGMNITGSDKANVIVGTGLADNINGGKGDDIIIGGAGADTIDGGAGNDVFLYDSTSTDNTGSGESITGGNDVDKIIVYGGTTAVDFSDDTIATVEKLELKKGADGTTADNNAQSLTMTNAQVKALEITGEVSNINSGDTIILSDAASIAASDALAVKGQLVLKLTDFASQSIVLADSAVTGSDKLYVDGSALTGSNAFTFNASAETENTVTFEVVGGAGADTITGGAGNDIIDLGSGADKMVYDGAASTAGDGKDTISGFTAGSNGDIFDLGQNVAAKGLDGNSVTYNTLGSTDDVGTSDFINNKSDTSASSITLGSGAEKLVEIDSSEAILVDKNSDSTLDEVDFRAIFGSGASDGAEDADSNADDILTFSNNDSGAGFFVVYDGTGTDADAYIFYVDISSSASDTAATISTGDTVQLIGQLVDVGANTLTDANFF